MRKDLTAHDVDAHKHKAFSQTGYVDDCIRCDWLKMNDDSVEYTNSQVFDQLRTRIATLEAHCAAWREDLGTIETNTRNNSIAYCPKCGPEQIVQCRECDDVHQIAERALARTPKASLKWAEALSATHPLRVKLWGAINEYANSCGGNTGYAHTKRYGNIGRRESAVVDVERIIEEIRAAADAHEKEGT